MAAVSGGNVAAPFAAANLEDFSRSHTLRIRQITVDDHCPAKRNCKEYAEAAAAGRYQKCLPEFEPLLVTDHKKSRNDKYNCGQRAGCRSLRLYHIVFQNV